MKKLLLSFLIALSAAASSFSQIMDHAGFKNTLWTGGGDPFFGDPSYYGFTDTFQARCDVNWITIEGMLNFGFLTNYTENGYIDNFEFSFTDSNHVYSKYGKRANYDSDRKWHDGFWFNNSVNVNNCRSDDYYVNFFFTPFDHFQFGAGTKLNWCVGPAPGYGDFLWQGEAHIRQGGFSTSYDDRTGQWRDGDGYGSYKYRVDAPGSADVVGFVPYANRYAKKALAARFVTFEKINLEIGAAMPCYFNTDHPAANFGIRLEPVEGISGSYVFEGAFDSRANMYAGFSFAREMFTLDAYAAFDSLFTDESNDEAYSVGAALELRFFDSRFVIRPEGSVNFFQEWDYTPAWYAGIKLDFAVTEAIEFNLWSSIAFGSKNKDWDDSYDKEVRDYDGGHIFNIRPGVKFVCSDEISFDLYFDFENRRAFDDKTRNCWSAGVLFTYEF